MSPPPLANHLRRLGSLLAVPFLLSGIGEKVIEILISTLVKCNAVVRTLTSMQFAPSVLRRTSNNIVHFTMPHLFEGQEELLLAAEKEAERLAAKGTHYLDANNDGQVNRKDFEL